MLRSGMSVRQIKAGRSLTFTDALSSMGRCPWASGLPSVYAIQSEAQVFSALLVVVFAAGALTILSPCVLPIIPLVFARAGRSFSREVLPMLVGLALLFAATASIATAGLAWLTQVSEAGRIVSFALLGLLGLSLIAPRVADILARPFVRLGSWIDSRGGSASTRI